MLSPPSIEPFLDTVRKCTKETAATLRVHNHSRRIGLETHSSLSTCLISVLLEAGNIVSARTIFDRTERKSGESWNSLLIAYVRFEDPQNALALYHTMGENSALLNEFAFVALLKACTNLADLEKGRDLHAQIARTNLLETNVKIGTTLVDMYAKCGIPTAAQEVFHRLRDPDVVAWTALIAGYAHHGYGTEALYCFELMESEGITPNATTFSSALKACGSISAEEQGAKIHNAIVRQGLLKTNQIVGNALVDMYAKCGSLAKAQEVFDVLPVKDVVSWTALIAGYAQLDRSEDALRCFEKMQRSIVLMDVVTFVPILKACGSIAAAERGKGIHDEITKRGLLKSNAVLGTALVDMYAKCGIVADAQSVFDDLQDHSLDSWNALISGYEQNKCGEEALARFEQMQREGFFPDAMTYACILSACGSVGAIERGQEVHTEIEQKGVLKTNLIIANALLDMYTKCGLSAKTQEVFEKLQIYDVISWNSLLTGYAQAGDIEKVLRLLHDMKSEGTQPNPVTFISVLNAFSHEGLVDEAELLFEAMGKEFGVCPTLEHYTRMVDLFGRAGQLGKAATVFKKMSSSSDLGMSLILLGACRKWGDVELGRQAFKQAVRLDEKEATAYFCMFDLYTNAGMLNEAMKIEAMRVRKKAQKHREIFDGLVL